MALDLQRGTSHMAIGVVFLFALVMGYILIELEETKQNFALQIIDQSSDRVQSELDEFFLPVRDITLTLKQQQDLQSFDQFPPSSYNSYLIPIIRQYPQVSSIGIADTRGYELNVLPDSVDGQWLNREVFVDRWGMKERWNRFTMDSTPVNLDSWEQPLQTDTRERPWFIGALERNGSHLYWTEPYVYMTEELGLTASILGAENSPDTVRNIIALDVTLTDITRFSQNLDLTSNNQVFVLTKPENNIIGLPSDYENLPASELQNEFLSTPKEFGSQPLIDLLKYPNDKIVSFESDGRQWWGIEKTYSVTPEQQLAIAILVPESDFSSEIDGTRSAMIGGFLLVLLLSTMLTLNHNKLRNLSFKLNDKNNVITEQKERLFAEVHHRVKNNLAVMAAFLELENMESTNPDVKQVLSQTQLRIKSMAAVHEVIYKSDDMKRVLITDFVPDILNYSKKGFAELDFDIQLDIKPILINVNQALTYALWINECMNSILKSVLEVRKSIDVIVEENNKRLITEITLHTNIDDLNKNDEVGRQLIQVLVSQLGGAFEVKRSSNKTLYLFSFELKDKKGITSNLNY